MMWDIFAELLSSRSASTFLGAYRRCATGAETVRCMDMGEPRAHAVVLSAVALAAGGLRSRRLGDVSQRATRCRTVASTRLRGPRHVDFPPAPTCGHLGHGAISYEAYRTVGMASAALRAAVSANRSPVSTRTAALPVAAS